MLTAQTTDPISGMPEFKRTTVSLRALAERCPNWSKPGVPVPERIVLIGFGPVGARFVEEMTPALRSGAATLTVIGAEPVNPYNRVLIAEYAVGAVDAETMSLGESTEAVDAGARILTGVTVTAILRTRRIVTVSSGEEIPYDRLVFATGARANVPTLDGIVKVRREHSAPPTDGRLDAGGGMLPVGVTALRDIADADEVMAAVAAGQRIVVLGAGVLGMEIALAAAKAGAQVCVVYHGGFPMARSLDRGSGTVLARAARRAGVSMVDHARAESVTLRLDDDGVERFDHLLCADGKQIAGDLLAAVVRGDSQERTREARRDSTWHPGFWSTTRSPVGPTHRCTRSATALRSRRARSWGTPPRLQPERPPG